MANDNDFKKEGSIKNPELLDSSKDTQDERLARGKRRVPQDGKGWVDTVDRKRADIEKPGMIYDDKTKTSMPTDKDINQQQTVNKGKANWDRWQSETQENKSVTINHDKEIQERIESKEKNTAKDISVNKDMDKQKKPNKDNDKDR